MREIKFRAWNEEQKKMWWFDLLWGNTTAHGSGWIGMVESPEEGKYRNGGDNRVQVEPEGKVFMQYTGLKDKNGKEIYEGDIVRLDNRDIGGSITVGEVMFNTDQTLSRLEWGLWTKRGYHYTDFLGDIEVIGNIYENKELLEDK